MELLTVGDIRKAIKEENLLWLPDENLKDTDAVPLLPTGALPEELPVPFNVVNIDRFLKEYNPTNPFLTERSEEGKK